jgi:isoquinoline 1-oxidoreductase
MKYDDYFEIDFTDEVKLPLTRREFLKLTGGGIFIFFTIGDSIAFAQSRGSEYPEDFNAYLRIGEDGRVTCYTGKIEMGQGIVTSLTQELSEELEVPLESIKMIMGDTDLCPYDRGTWGSRTTRFFGPALRAAGAKAKLVLMELASEKLDVPLSQLIAEKGSIFNKTKTKKLTYAQLAKGKKMGRHLEQNPEVKSASEFKIISKPVNRLDSLEKVTGKAKFAGDILLPDMLYARILRPPAHDAELISVDTSVAEEIEGVQVAKDGDLIAVLHKYPDIAEEALAKVKAKFNQPEAKVDDESIFDYLLKVAPEGEVVDESGELKKGKKRASTIVEGTYLDGYVAHSPIETHTSVAQVKGNKATVWASTQAPFRVKDQVAEALGFPPENVRIITPFVGGGFGGKSPSRQSIEAARLAKLTGKPVQVAWTRAEEFFYDTFRPAAVVKIKSGLSNAGKITFWDYQVYSAGSRGSKQFYNIPHHRTVSHRAGRGSANSHPFATGAWRAPGNNTNCFARESQIQALAVKAGMDPLDFWLQNLKEEKMRRVLKATADKFGYTPAKSPSGRGYGIGCGIDVGTYVATIADVDVDKNTGNVRVKRVVCAQDMGLVINPEGARIQMEGCITMGLGYALTEDVHFKGGEILDLNFDTYEIPRFSWLPKIETLFVNTDDPVPQGGGEPAIIVMGGVIANAIYDAIGVRLYQLPMTPERIREALSKG